MRRLPLPCRSDFDLTVVTNAPDVARILIDREGFEILLIGGRVDTRSVLPLVHRRFRKLAACTRRSVFPGACAIDSIMGYGVSTAKKRC
jgi:DeoR/GlpR family transcriptional regulator of sugar metabolism